MWNFRAGKVRDMTPKMECCLGKYRHKLSGRANKRCKYNKCMNPDKKHYFIDRNGIQRKISNILQIKI